MDFAFTFDRYLLKRQVFALTGKFRFFDPNGQLVLFSEQKMFRLREDIRVYSDETKSREVLMIKARQIIDFSAAFDVVDSATGQKIGALRRPGYPTHPEAGKPCPCAVMPRSFDQWRCPPHRRRRKNR